MNIYGPPSNLRHRTGPLIVMHSFSILSFYLLPPTNVTTIPDFFFLRYSSFFIPHPKCIF